VSVCFRNTEDGMYTGNIMLLEDVYNINLVTHFQARLEL